MLKLFEGLAVLMAVTAMAGFGWFAEPGTVDVWLTPTAIGIILATWAWHWRRAYLWSSRWAAVTRAEFPAGIAALDALDDGPLHEAAAAFRRSLVSVDGRAFRLGSAAEFIHPGADVEPDLDAPPSWLANGHALLLSLGLLGTFLGLTIGLAAVDLGGQDPAKLVGEIAVLFSGAKLAFAKSVAGIAFSIVWSYRWRTVEQEYEAYFERVVRALDRGIPLQTATHALALALQSMADRGERAIAAASDRADAPLRDVIAEQRATHEAVVAGSTGLARLLREAIERQANDSAEERAALQSLGELLIDGFSPRLQEALAATLVPILTQVRDQGQQFGAAAAREMSDAMLSAQGVHLDTLSASFAGTTNALNQTHAVVTTNTDLLARTLAGLNEQLGGLREATGGLAGTLGATVAPLLQVRDDLDAATQALAATTTGLEAERGCLMAAADALHAGETLVTTRQDAIATALLGLLEQVDAIRGACGSLLDVTQHGTTASLESVQSVGHAVAALELAAQLTQAHMDTSRGRISEAAGQFDLSTQGTTRSTAEAIGLVTAAIKAAGDDFRAQVTAMGTAVKPVREDLERAAKALGESVTATTNGAHSLNAAGQNLEGSLGKATQPLDAFRKEMVAVTTSLNGAAHSIESERAALQGLGSQLQTQSQALSNQIAQFRGLLTKEVADNLEGVRKSNAAIATTWATVNEQTLRNLDQFAARSQAYADHIGNTITLPRDVQNLDGTLADLRDTLRHLTTVLNGQHGTPEGQTA